MGAEGFSSASSLLYHRHSPSAIVAVEPVPTPSRRARRRTSRSLPHHLRTACAAGRRRPGDRAAALLGNDDVAVSLRRRPTGSSGLYRDATGDELVYVQSGAGVLESGVRRAGGRRRGLRRDPDVDDPPLGASAARAARRALIVAAAGHVAAAGQVPAPSRASSSRARRTRERDLRGPDRRHCMEDGDDVDGARAPPRRADPLHVTPTTRSTSSAGTAACTRGRCRIHDFEPIVGRIHQPPPVHQTFAGAGFVVCSFVPRLFDLDPDAIKMPYHHANVDSDEVLFYSAGDFMSRAGSGIGVGSISLHPAGFVHGPQPGSLRAQRWTRIAPTRWR